MYIIKRFVKYFRERTDRDNDVRFAAQPLAEGITEIRDVPYLDGGNIYHNVDIYYPEGTKEKLPVVINMHGGGLVYGTRAINRNFNFQLAKQGFTVFAPDYRLMPEDSFERCVGDMMSAMKWVEENLAEYPADRDKLYIVGDSAGAYLAVLCAMIAKSERLQGVYGTVGNGLDIKAMGLISGMFDLDWKSPFTRGIRRMAMYKRKKGDPIRKNYNLDMPEAKDLPPCYMVTSADDNFIPAGMTDDFAAVLERHGIEYFYRYYEKEQGGFFRGHVFCVSEPHLPHCIEVIEEIKDFLLKH